MARGPVTPPPRTCRRTARRWHGNKHQKHSEKLKGAADVADVGLNEELVQLLLLRDELHVEQDAMLVDIEDLTR